MEFITLEHLPFPKIYKAFTEAFADYIISLKISEQELKDKFQRDNVNLKLSAGVVKNQELIAFIFHGNDNIDGENIDGENIIYNAGTGVVPSARGSGLTKKMYEFLLPHIKENNIHKAVLEVIEGNIAARKSYEQIGFQITRNLTCFSGALFGGKPLEVDGLEIFESKLDRNLFRSFWNFEPTWQNHFNAIERMLPRHKIYVAAKNESIIGYIICSTGNGYISQLAVAPEWRRKGIATALLHYLHATGVQKFNIINIDSSDSATNKFFENAGLSITIHQWDMKWHIHH